MDTTSSIKRKNTRQILVGDVPVGGESAPNSAIHDTTKTSDVDATCSRFIH
ncbi:MAG: hypothetical protein Ct9H90mP11_05470 [Acidimicrobiales bacterium]|nr:MAG: hypothetical protein Ct9H90mP11_05470 [Acidimicrobiales bacterium]